MKRIILISAMFAAATSFAQTTPDNALFKFDNTGSPKEISKLGTAPEFPFMRNLSSPHQVVAMLKRNDERNTAGMDQLNQLLMAVGFDNGAKDVTEANVSTYYVPVGTQGNMGSAGYGVEYAQLSGDASEFKAWKIASGNGNYLYLMAKCGNAFFPNSQTKGTACITTPVTVTGDPKEMTLTANGQKTTTTDKVFVYYHKKHHKRREAAFAVAGVPDAYPSKLLLLNSTDKVDIVPENYKISLSAADNTIKVCPGVSTDVAANINVEKTSEYSGYYPTNAKAEYKRVSKHVFRRSERKMRRARRKENKVAKITGVEVNRAS